MWSLPARFVAVCDGPDHGVVRVCRTVVHRRCRFLGRLVLRPPPVLFGDGRHDDPHVGDGSGLVSVHTNRGLPSFASTVAAMRSISGASIPAASRASRTTVARSARCSAKVLPDQWRETRTRRPPSPRWSRSWAFPAQRPATQAGAGILGLDAVAEPVRAPLGAGQVLQLGVQPVDVRLIARDRVGSSSSVGV